MSYPNTQLTDYKNVLVHYIKNGVYIPFLQLALFYLTNDLFLSSIIAIKLYPANYYSVFYHHYQYRKLPKWVGIFKQFIRFTDTGNMVSFLYFFYPEFFPLAFNIHFFITFGFWGCVLFLNMRDLDDRYHPEIMTKYATLWSIHNHIAPFALFVREFFIHPELCTYSLFSLNNLFHSYKWLYGWFIFIYLPWRIMTHDCVYSVLSYDTSIKTLVELLLFIHTLFIFSNINGFLLQEIIC